MESFAIWKLGPLPENNKFRPQFLHDHEHSNQKPKKILQARNIYTNHIYVPIT